MQDRATSVLLREGVASKVYAAEVTNRIGNPLKGVEVTFRLNGGGSLAAGDPVSSIVTRTDGLGSAFISFNRPYGVDGCIGASLTAHCQTGVGDIRLRLVAIKAAHP